MVAGNFSYLSRGQFHFRSAAKKIPGSYMTACGIQSEITTYCLSRLACREAEYHKQVGTLRLDLHMNLNLIKKEQTRLKKTIRGYAKQKRKKYYKHLEEHKVVTKYTKPLPPIEGVTESAAAIPDGDVAPTGNQKVETEAGGAVSSVDGPGVIPGSGLEVIAEEEGAILDEHGAPRRDSALTMPVDIEQIHVSASTEDNASIKKPSGKAMHVRKVSRKEVGYHSKNIQAKHPTQKNPPAGKKDNDTQLQKQESTSISDDDDLDDDDDVNIESDSSKHESQAHDILQDLKPVKPTRAKNAQPPSFMSLVRLKQSASLWRHLELVDKLSDSISTRMAKRVAEVSAMTHPEMKTQQMTDQEKTTKNKSTKIRSINGDDTNGISSDEKQPRSRVSDSSSLSRQTSRSSLKEESGSPRKMHSSRNRSKQDKQRDTPGYDSRSSSAQANATKTFSANTSRTSSKQGTYLATGIENIATSIHGDTRTAVTSNGQDMSSSNDHILDPQTTNDGDKRYDSTKMTSRTDQYRNKRTTRNFGENVTINPSDILREIKMKTQAPSTARLTWQQALTKVRECHYMTEDKHFDRPNIEDL